MYVYVYVEINLLCVAFLSYVLATLETNSQQHSGALAFRHTVISLIWILIVDCFWVVLNGNPAPWAVTSSKLVMAAYLILECVSLRFWLLYVEEDLGIRHRASALYDRLLWVPLAVSAILSVYSIWSGALFSYDASGTYVRGPWFLFQLILPLSYQFLSVVEILQAWKKARLKEDRERYLSMLSFIIMPILGLALMLALVGIPALWPFAALSLLVVFTDMQVHQISTDNLTQINNRRQFDKRIDSYLGNNPGSAVSLIMMDIDNFKKINDTYGHYQGDAALIETAELLKSVAGDNNVFLARYGGDEFAMLFPDRDGLGAKLVAEIDAAFAKRNRETKSPYRLELSYGIGTRQPADPKFIPGLIEDADRELYLQKKRKLITR